MPRRNPQAKRERTKTGKRLGTPNYSYCVFKSAKLAKEIQEREKS